jgi:hypothetical protein
MNYLFVQILPQKSENALQTTHSVYRFFKTKSLKCLNHLYFQQGELSGNRTFFLSVLSPIIPHDSLSFVSPVVAVYLG